MRTPIRFVSDRRHSEVVRLTPEQPPVGRAVLSYISKPTRLGPQSRALTGHPNNWESREFAMALLDAGFMVTAVDFNSDDTGLKYLETQEFDVGIGISPSILDLADNISGKRFMLHLTGSFPEFQNTAEACRVNETENRAKTNIAQHRQVPRADEYSKAIADSYHCTLIGNKVTRATYPQYLQEFINLTNVTYATPLPRTVTARDRPQMTFMALAGSGAILKGLDLAIEAFISTPGRTLHIVGALEADFVTAYGPLIAAAPNIHAHGFLRFGSRKLTKLLNTCSVLISPSCSEGMSSAVVTGIACGMYPIISRQTGVDLPTDSGLYLENLSVEAIHSAIEEYTKISRDDVTMATTQGATEARERYSRVHRAKQIRLDVTTVLAAS